MQIFIIVLQVILFSSTSFSDDVLVTPHNTTTNQLSPKVAVSDSGKFVIVWTENSQDLQTWAVYAKIFDSTGSPVGENITVVTGTNTLVSPHSVTGISPYILITNRDYSVSIDSAGNFAVVLLVGTDRSNISALRFSSTGEKVGETIQVSSGGKKLYSPHSVLNDEGQLAVVWVLTWGDGETHIFFRAFDSEGVAISEAEKISGELRINFSPRIVETQTGEYGVVWGDEKPFNTTALHSLGVRYLLVNAYGKPHSDLLSFQVGFIKGRFSPMIAINQNDDLAIIWGSYIQTPNIEPNGILMKTINSRGEVLGTNTQILSPNPENPILISLLTKGDGHFAMISKDADNSNDIFVQVFDLEGHSVDKRTSANSESSRGKDEISAAMNIFGKHVVVWTSERIDTNKKGIYFSLFEALDTNPPPVADAGHDISVYESDLFVLNAGNSYDSNGYIASYSWKSLTNQVTINWVSSDVETPELSISNIAQSQTVVTLELTVTDNDGKSSTDQVEVVVNKREEPAEDPNEPPVEEGPVEEKIADRPQSEDDSQNTSVGSMGFFMVLLMGIVVRISRKTTKLECITHLTIE
ncbi:MAG: hypothetical protein OEZ47_16575 [Gammaproteobacteria bacterium]|nr:hypothetical protein [Gammaproteobacteria bacterium]